MVSSELSANIWTNYLEFKYENLDIENVRQIPVFIWSNIRQEYLSERRTTWKLLQEIIRLADSNGGSDEENVSPTKNNFKGANLGGKIMEMLNPRRIMDTLNKHFDAINHWYPQRFSFENLEKFAKNGNGTAMSAEQQKEFIYQHKLDWILYTLEEVVFLLDTMTLFTYKQFHLNYKQLENITRILLSDNFNRLTSLWTNYCPVQSTQTFHFIKHCIEKINFKFILLFAESLQFWRVFSQGDSDQQLTSHPLSDSKEPIPVKDMINICKNILSNTNMNQLMLMNGPSAGQSPHRGGGALDQSMTLSNAGDISNSIYGIIHKSTRNMLIYLWIKFLQTYEGPESAEEDWNQTILQDNDIQDDSIEENLLETFVKLLKMSYSIEYSSFLMTPVGVTASASSLVGDATTKQLFSISGTVLNEMLNIFIKFRVLKDVYSTSEINDLVDITALLQMIYLRQTDLAETFCANWELSSALSKEENANMFPLIHFIQVLIQYTSSEPIYLIKVLLGLFSSCSSSNSSVLADKMSTMVLSVLNSFTPFVTEEPFEYLKKLSSNPPTKGTNGNQTDPKQMKHLIQNAVWIEQLESETILPYNTKLVYCHDDPSDEANDPSLHERRRDGVNIHGGLWAPTDNELSVERPFNSVHWYENNQRKRSNRINGEVPNKASFSIRGPFYSSIGSLLSIDYEKRNCQILWDDKFTWLENLLDHLLTSFFHLQHSPNENGSEEEWNLIYSTIELFSFFFSSPSATTNLQFSYFLNNLWNKISWSYLLKSCHLNSYLEDIISPTNSITTKLFYSFLKSVIPNNQITIDLETLKSFIETFFANHKINMEEEDLNIFTVKMQEILSHQLEQRSNNHHGTKWRNYSYLFVSFNEIMLSLFTKRISSFCSKNSDLFQSKTASTASSNYYSSSTAGTFSSPNHFIRRKLHGLPGEKAKDEKSAIHNPDEFYHFLQQFLLILIHFTTSSSNNLELALFIIEELTQNFSEKWLIVLNNLIENGLAAVANGTATQSIASAYHTLSLKLKLKAYYYQFLNQLISHFQFVSIKVYQKLTNMNISNLLQSTFGGKMKENSNEEDNQDVYIAVLVVISNIEIFMSSELDNIMNLDSSINLYSLTNSTFFDVITLRKLLLDYLHYYSQLFHCYMDVNQLYIQYEDLLLKRKLVISKEKLDVMMETVLLVSLLCTDYYHYDQFLFKRSAGINKGMALSVGSNQQEKNKLWKDFLSNEATTVPGDSSLSSPPISFPFPYELLMENSSVQFYLSDLMKIAQTGFRMFSFILSFNETIFQNYQEMIQNIYFACLETPPNHYIRSFHSLFSSCSSSLSAIGISSDFKYNFNQFNNFLLLFTYVSFSLKHSLLRETKLIRLASAQILSKLITFPEFYYQYCYGVNPSFTKKTLIEMLVNANLYFLNELFMKQLMKKNNSTISTEEQVSIWNLLTHFLEFHPNIISLMFSFHTLPSGGATKGGKPAGVDLKSLLESRNVLPKNTGRGDDNEDKEDHNLLYVLLEYFNNLDYYYKEKPFLLYSVLTFMIKLILKSKLFPLLGKIAVYLISQEKFWDNLLKPLLNPSVMSLSGTSGLSATTASTSSTSSYNKPTNMLNDFMTAYDALLRQDLFGNSETQQIHLQSVLEQSSSVSEEEENEEGFLKNNSAFSHLHLTTEKEIHDISRSIQLYTQQMLIFSSIFKMLSLERYGVFYELNPELAMKTTTKINALFISANHKSKFWSWIQQFLTVHIHHSLIQKCETELNNLLSLSLKDLLKMNSFSNSFFMPNLSHFNSVILFPSFSQSSPGFAATAHPHSEYLMNSQRLYQSLEELTFHHFHYSNELSSWKFKFLHGMSKNITYLTLINYHYSISVVDLLVLFHFKEFLQLFILPGSLTKQFIAKYKQEKQQKTEGTLVQNNFLPSGESKITTPAASNVNLAAFSADPTVPSSPAIGALSPETNQPDASPLSLRESSFQGDKRSYEIVNEILKKLTTLVVTSHSMEVSGIHSDRSSPSLEAALNRNAGSASVPSNPIGLNPVSQDDQEGDPSQILSSSSSTNIQFILQSLFGLISISENCSLLINMIHHQLKAITFKDANPEKSVILNRDIGSARLTEDKIEKLLHQILMIYQYLFQMDDNNAKNDDDNALFHSWKQDLSNANLLDELFNGDESFSVSHSTKLVMKNSLKHFFTTISSQSTSHLSLNQIISYFIQMVLSSSSSVGRSGDRNDEIVKVLKKVPFSYYKYQIKSSLFTSMLLLLNSVQYHYQQLQFSSLAVKIPSVLSASALSKSGGEVHYQTENRLLTLQFSFHYFKELLKYFGIYACASPNSSSKSIVEGQKSLATVFHQIHHFIQILFQMMKISLPKSSFGQSSSTGKSGSSSSSFSADVLLNPLHYKQLLSFFHKEEFFAYLMELLNYLTSFVVHLPAQLNNYSSIIRSVSGSQQQQKTIDENDLKIDVNQDSDYLTLSTAALDLSVKSTNIFPSSNTADSSSAQNLAEMISHENVLCGMLTIYDLILYYLENSYCLSFAQELSYYKQILSMINNNSLLREFQKTLLSSSQNGNSAFIASLFMGYNSNAAHKESLVNKVWLKTLTLVEIIIQKVFNTKERKDFFQQKQQKDDVFQQEISNLSKQLIEFLQSYESLLFLPLLSIGNYRYTLQQLVLIQKVFYLFSLFHSFCPFYKTFLPNIPVLLQLKSLQFVANASYYCFYAEDFYIESQQINLLSTSIIMNVYENVPIKLSEKEEEMMMRVKASAEAEAEDEEDDNQRDESKPVSISLSGDKRGFITSRPSFASNPTSLPPPASATRNLSTESAHVHFGNDQLFLISQAATASNDGGFSSPTNNNNNNNNNSQLLRGLPTSRGVSTPVSGGTPSVKPVSILKSTSKSRFGDRDTHAHDDLLLPPPSSIQSFAPPPSMSKPAHSLSRHFDRSISSGSDYYYGGTSTSTSAGPLPNNNNNNPNRYRLGYYQSSNSPYLSFILLLEKELMKTLKSVQHYLKLVLPACEGPCQENLSLLSCEQVATKYPVGMKMIFFSRLTNTLVEGVIHQFYPTSKTFDFILLSNNLIEKGITLEQLKYQEKPLIAFRVIHELNRKVDFYSFPIMNSSSFFSRSGSGTNKAEDFMMRGNMGNTTNTIPTTGNVIAAYDHLYGTINLQQILSTSHFYRMLAYLMSMETKERLVLSSSPSLQQPSSTSSSASTTPAPQGTTSKGATLSSLLVNNNPQTVNKKLQTLQNSFVIKEYLQFIMELIYVYIYSLHHHSYGMTGGNNNNQELAMIQQLIDLQHLFSSFNQELLANHEKQEKELQQQQQQQLPSGQQRERGNSESNLSGKSPAGLGIKVTSLEGSSSSSTVSVSALPDYLQEWKEFLTFIYSWMEEIYYRLEQSIGIDLTDAVVPPMVTPMKKDGKFRLDLLLRFLLFSFSYFCSLFFYSSFLCLFQKRTSYSKQLVRGHSFLGCFNCQRAFRR
jgi:hypothetical protein